MISVFNLSMGQPHMEPQKLQLKLHLKRTRRNYISMALIIPIHSTKLWEVLVTGLDRLLKPKEDLLLMDLTMDTIKLMMRIRFNLIQTFLTLSTKESEDIMTSWSRPRWDQLQLVQHLPRRSLSTNRSKRTWRSMDLTTPTHSTRPWEATMTTLTDLTTPIRSTRPSEVLADSLNLLQTSKMAPSMPASTHLPSRASKTRQSSLWSWLWSPCFSSRRSSSGRRATSPARRTSSPSRPKMRTKKEAPIKAGRIPPLMFFEIHPINWVSKLMRSHN